MANQNGIEINLRLWLPIGETIDEQITALTLVKDARETQTYEKLMAAASLEAIKTDQKTRRVADKPATTQEPGQDAQTTGEASNGTGEDPSGLKAAFDAVPPVGPVDDEEPAGTVGGAQMEGDDDPATEIPAFLQKSAATAE